MKKLSLIVTLMGALTSLQCWALTVNVTRIDGYYQYPGGEFNVASVASDPAFTKILNLYSANTIVNGGFETFCDSTATGLYPNPQTGTIAPGNVSVGAAWLYGQFVHGTLTGYDYVDTTPGGSGNSLRAQSAYMLQQAIWVLNGQTGGDVNAAAAAYYVNMATAIFGTSGAYLLSNGAGGVEELFLTYTAATGGQVISQPMLVYVPDGGWTIIMLGMALTGCGLAFRRYQRA